MKNRKRGLADKLIKNLILSSAGFAVILCLALSPKPEAIAAEQAPDETKKRATPKREFDRSELKGPVTISADNITQNKKAGTATATGNVAIEYTGATLYGKRCYLDNNTGIGIMEEDVKLVNPGGTVYGSRFEFDIDTGLGELDDAVGYTKGGYNFTADKATRIEEFRYILKNSSITTCDPKDPDWLFKSSSTDFRTENYATFDHAKFFFKKLPIFYFPKWGMPTVTKRKTGFLFPEFGYSNINGTYFNPSYFIALSDQHDITFRPGFLNLRGIKHGLEYNYAFAKRRYGKLDVNYINDKLTNSKLWSIDWAHRDRLKYGIENRVKLEKESDVSYSKEFSLNKSVRSKRFTDSYVEFSKTYSTSQVSMLARSYEDITSSKAERKEIYQKMPEVAGSILPHEIFGMPLVGDITGKATTFSSETLNGSSPLEKLDIQRLHLRPRLSLPLVPSSGLNIKPFLEGRLNSYNRTKSDNESLSTEYYRAGLTMDAPKIFRIFKGEETSYKHTLSPRITYNYLPGYEVDGEDRLKAPKLDNLDSGSPTSLLSLSLINRVLMKSETNSLSREIVTLYITQGYNFNEANRKTGSSIKRPFSNMIIDLDSRPTSWLVLNNLLSYNHYGKRTDSMLTELGAIHSSGVYLSFDRNYRREPKSVTFSGVLGYTVGNGISAEASAIYYEDKKEMPAHQFKLEYRSCCYIASFAATGMQKTRGLEDGSREKYWDINYALILTFNGLGSTGKDIGSLVGRKI